MSPPPFPALEAELSALAPAIAFPPTPDLASLTAARIAAERPDHARPAAGKRRRLSWPAWRPLAPIALALAAVAAVVLVASPGAREAVASVFRGVPGIELIFGDGVVDPAPTPTAAPASVTAPTSAAAPQPSPTATAAESPSAPAPSPTRSSPPPPPGTISGFGTPTTLAAARAAVPFRVLVPAALGAPDSVFLDRRVGRGMVTMQWRARPGLPDAGNGVGAVFTQFDTGVDPGFPYFLKEMGGSANIEFVIINGGDGGWITGGHPVSFAVRGDSGARQVVTSRLAANTLLWVQNAATMRLETALGKTETLAIAESLR